jgi:hypothetical protein
MGRTGKQDTRTPFHLERYPPLGGMNGDLTVKNGSTNRFWFVLTVINLLALSYPIILLHRAETTDSYLFATFVLIGCVFLLTVIDFVSIVIADGLDELNGSSSHHRGAQRKRPT